MIDLSAQDRRVTLVLLLAAAMLGACSGSTPPGHAATTTAPAATARTAAHAGAANANAVAPTESPIARLMRMLDRNGDGRISRDEHADSASRMFGTMDADHDGQVTAAEMDATRQGLFGAAATAAAAIAKVDGNDDCLLSAQEHATATALVFDRVDSDHDGVLTAAELQAGDSTTP